MQHKPFTSHACARPLVLSSLLCALAICSTPARAVVGTIVSGSVQEPQTNHYFRLEATTSRLTLSPTAITALNALQVLVEPVPPGGAITALTPRAKYASIALEAPIHWLTADASDYPIDPTQFLVVKPLAATALAFGTQGGFKLSTQDDGITSSGGSLILSNLSVNIADQRIHADINGANGVGHIEQMSIWRFDAMTPLRPLTHTSCDASFTPSCYTTFTVDTSLSGLRLEAEAFDTIVQSLGMLPDGQSTLRKVSDFGTFATAVPEPATWAQMGLGLVALSLMAARHRHRAP